MKVEVRARESESRRVQVIPFKKSKTCHELNSKVVK